METEVPTYLHCAVAIDPFVTRESADDRSDGWVEYAIYVSLIGEQRLLLRVEVLDAHILIIHLGLVHLPAENNAMQRVTQYSCSRVWWAMIERSMVG